MRREATFGRFVSVLAILLFATTPALPQSTKLVSESYSFPARDPGIQLFVRNKHPEGMTQFRSDRTLLFVHGATYPAETSFDLSLGGFSWMDYIAQRGWDVYLMDVRGYGRSTRPPEMSQPPSANPPIVNGEVAVKDISDVVDHILARRHVQRIALLGWSWGTTLMGTYTTQNNEKVERLVLYAPIWIRETPSLIRVQGPLGAYRSVTMEQAQERWLFGVPAEKQKDLIPAGWFDTWWKAALESDPVGAAQTPPAVRAPNGVLDDGQKYTDRAYWDPRKARSPC